MSQVVSSAARGEGSVRFRERVPIVPAGRIMYDGMTFGEPHCRSNEGAYLNVVVAEVCRGLWGNCRVTWGV